MYFYINYIDRLKISKYLVECILNDYNLVRIRALLRTKLNLCKKVLHANDFTSALGKTKTFPSILPSRALDRIFYRGELQIINAFAGHTKLARAASDHLPIIADFLIPL